MNYVLDIMATSIWIIGRVGIGDAMQEGQTHRRQNAKNTDVKKRNAKDRDGQQRVVKNRNAKTRDANNRYAKERDANNRDAKNRDAKHRDDPQRADAHTDRQAQARMDARAAQIAFSGCCASVTARCGQGLAGDTQKVMPALFTHLIF